jgi:hypothetical protein
LGLKFRSIVGNVLTNVTLRFVSLTAVVVKKLFYIFWCLLVDFVMQQAKRMRLVIF